MRWYRIAIGKSARRQLRQELGWWADNVGVPSPFSLELARVLLLLRSFPGLGHPVAGRAGRHRKLLRKSQYLLDYLVDDARGIVTVTRVVHTSRRRR